MVTPHSRRFHKRYLYSFALFKTIKQGKMAQKAVDMNQIKQVSKNRDTLLYFYFQLEELIEAVYIAMNKKNKSRDK
jgi:hypothetical protein